MTDKQMKRYDDVVAAGLDDWRMLAQAIHARFTTGDFATGLRLVAAIGAAAEEVNHHPDVTLTYPKVDVSLMSHDAGWVTQRDLDLARTISDLARDLGVGSDPSGLAQLEAALDTPDSSSVRPFWRAFLGYDALADAADELRDPHGHGPNIWLQDSGSEVGRQRWHFDVFLPGEQVQARIDAVVAAGGKVVGEFPEHSYWVVEDPEGNRSCICTAQGRG
jgi:4a-hydroxytetrahydrobiopterin dehydratase